MNEKNIEPVGGGKAALNSIVNMVAAITNIRIFPPSSSVTGNFIDMAHNALSELLEKQESVIVAESEKNLLFCEQPFEEKDLKKPQIATFLEMFFKFGIKSIIFNRGLEKEEFKNFLQILSMRTEELDKEGGIQEVVAKKDFPHILLNKKIYVATDKDWVGPAGTDFNKNIVKYLMESGLSSDEAAEKAEQMASDPKWLSEIIQSGIRSLTDSAGKVSGAKLSDTFGQMLDISNDIKDENTKRDFFQQTLGHLTEMDGSVVTTVLGKQLQGISIQDFDKYVIGNLDDGAFERLLIKIKGEHDRLAASKENQDSPLFQPVNLLLDKIMSSKRGQMLQKKIEKRTVSEKEKIARFKNNLKSLLEGGDKAFHDKKLMEILPNLVVQLFKKERDPTAQAVIKKLANGLDNSDMAIRTLAANALLNTLDATPPEKLADVTLKIQKNLLSCIRDASELSPDYQRIFIHFQNNAETLIKKYEFPHTLPILETLNDMHLGNTETPEPLQVHAGKVLEAIATTEVLDILLAELKTNEHKQSTEARKLLTKFGVLALNPVLDMLSESEARHERSRVLHLVSEIGVSAAPAVAERIEPGGPWYLLRNLTLLLGKIGNETHVKVLEPLLKHKDIRVQIQALNTINKIGGKYRGEIFLNMLPTADDILKVQLVKLLGTLRYPDAVKPLMDLLSSKSIFSSKSRDEIEEAACISLGQIGEQEALPILKGIVDQKGLKIKPYSTTVKTAANKAVEMIEGRQKQISGAEPSAEEAVETIDVPESKTPEEPEPQVQEPRESREDREEEITTAESEKANEAVERPKEAPLEESRLKVRQPEIPKIKDDDLMNKEKLVDQYVGQGKKEAAVGLLFDLIVRHAKGKNFSKAETLRERLFEVDSMALTEIVRSAEIIEKEKAESIDQKHLDIWSNLYKALTKEEANTLYHSMSEAEYGANQPVFIQGEHNSKLFFINHGEAKMVYNQEGMEILLKILHPGDIAGEDAFFSDAICTTSVITISRTRLNYLEREAATKWVDEYPSLNSKLHSYCSQFKKVEDLLKEKDLDRRSLKRVVIPGKVIIQHLSAAGRPIGSPFKGDLMDISVGGLSFSMKILKRESASLLLGRKINTKFLFPVHETQLKIDQHGTVVGIRSNPLNEYSIHIKFDRTLDNQIVADMERYKFLAK